MSIKFLLVLNKQGKKRILKWYEKSETNEQKLVTRVHKIVSRRDQRKLSNFCDFDDNKLVFKRYAGLFFVLCVDSDDSEFASLESIHFFVEVLDSYFNNVCELDLVFNFYKVYSVIDQVFCNGEMQEMSKQVILDRLNYLDKLM